MTNNDGGLPKLPPRNTDGSAFSRGHDRTGNNSPVSSEPTNSSGLSHISDSSSPVQYEADYDDEMVSSRTKKVKIKKMNVAIAVAVIAVPAILFGVQNAPNWSLEGDENSTENVAPVPDSAPIVFYENDEGGMEYPVKTEEWQERYYNDETYPGDQQDDMRKAYQDTELFAASKTLPSKEAGFTSDLSKVELPDGTLNPVFTFATDEDYQNSAGQYVERLINPMYGGWEEYTYPREDGAAVDSVYFMDMFTSKYLEKNAKSDASKWLPIYADWNNDNYRMKDTLLGKGPRWVGELESTTSKFKYDDATGQYNVDVTANVKYTAWTKSQELVTKKGILKLKLVTNTEAPKDQEHKFLIDAASLKVS